MKKILIATHGHMASGMKNSIEILAGDSFWIETIDAYTPECEEDYSKRIQSFISAIEKEDEAVIFTDLLGGSVNQKVCQLNQENKENIFIVTGSNLMCILGVLLEVRILNKSIMQEIISMSCVTLVEQEINKENLLKMENIHDFLG